jgi:hypothetical protein
MTYSQTIRNGFRLINSRWQLIAVQAAMMLLNCIGFFILVGIPLGIAFVIFGLDLTGLAEIKDIFALFHHPAELLSKYFGLVLVVLTSFLLYVVAVTTIGLYVLAGSVGFIGRCIEDPTQKFSMRAFFAEAKKLFARLMWFALFVGLVFIGIAFVLGLFGGGIAAVVSAAKSQDSTLALFLGIFFSLVLALIGLALILGTLAATVYGIAVLYFKKKGAIASFRTAVRFLWKHQSAFWLYVILLLGYILASFVVMLVVYPFNLIPIIGTIISFPFQILSYVAQAYFGLVIFAVIFSYYHEAEIRETVTAEPQTPPEPPQDTTAGSSTPEESISIPQGAAQEPPPAVKDDTEEN